MGFAEIEKKIADFGKRAQDGKLAIEELTGGTFSISNGGVFGSMLSTPIINPPQIGHPRRARHQGAAGGRERPDRGPADELPRALLRSPHHRRPRSGLVPGKHQRGAGRSGAPASSRYEDLRRRRDRRRARRATSPRSAPRSSASPRPASRNGRRPRASPRSAAPASTSAASRPRRCSNPPRTTSACCTISRRTASPRAGSSST